MCAAIDVTETQFFIQNPNIQLPQIKGKFSLTHALLQPQTGWLLISLAQEKNKTKLIILGATGCKGFILVTGWLFG